jgi:hypothetical protein
MDNIVLARILHGSHLFGLSTPASDRDYVSIVLPSAARLLMSDGFFISDEGSTSDSTRKNTSADIDDKQYSLGRFIELCASGTLDAIELLNAPPEFHVIDPHPLFLELVAQKHRLVSRNFDKIIGFCRSQAVTYSPRKERYTAATVACETLIALGVTDMTKSLAGEYFERVVDACDSEYVSVKTVPNANGRPMPHLDICGKMVAETVHASQALIVAKSAVKRYGKRVRDVANTSEGDWKSLSHALRVAYEGIEFIRTGAVTLPIPNRSHILDVKLGRIQMEDVAAEIDEVVQKLVSEAKASPLQEFADIRFMNEFIMSAYGRRIVSDFDALEAEFATITPLKLSSEPAMLGTSNRKII